MERLFEFVGNHPVLVLAFIGLWVVFFAIESRRGGQSLSTQQVTNLVNREDGVLLDIRDSADFGEAHIAGSINIPLSKLDERMAELDKYKEKPLIIICNQGTTASSAGRQLKAKGFAHIWRLQGGIQNWRAEKLPLVKA